MTDHEVVSSDSDLDPGGSSSDREARDRTPRPGTSTTRRGAADLLAPLFASFFPNGVPVRVEFWDGTSLGERTGFGVARVNDPTALRHMLWAPGELGLGRAFVGGHLDIDGDIIRVLDVLHHGGAAQASTPAVLRHALRAAWRLGVIGAAPPVPSVEAHQHGRLHSMGRDRAAIHHHYDVGNEFYELFLGPSMTYSCARFADADTTLDQAQTAKFELVCRKLGLQRRSGMRLLDVGCGWGSLAIHAAVTYGARVVGISISEEQVELARRRVSDAGVSDLVDIRLQDYRDLDDEPFEAISSVGMFEHVGARRMGEYFAVLHDLLVPTGRLLNHAISSVGGSRLGDRTFIGRYVFPDGELIDLSEVIAAMQGAGFEVRDVESLREHYATTLRCWVQNLEGNWDRAVELVGQERARVWRLYMAASSVGFSDAGISIFQTLGVRDTPEGVSQMDRTRREFAV